MLGMKQRQSKVKAIAENVEKGSAIYTDDRKGYRDIRGEYHSYESVKHSLEE